MFQIAAQASTGRLTLQARDLGEWLARRYRNELRFLPPAASADQVHARTTNYRRTRATLSAVLAGIFPGTSQAVTAMAGTFNDEILLPQVNRCPELAAMFAQAREHIKDTVRIW